MEEDIIWELLKSDIQDFAVKDKNSKGTAKTLRVERALRMMGFKFPAALSQESFL